MPSNNLLKTKIISFLKQTKATKKLFLVPHPQFPCLARFWDGLSRVSSGQIQWPQSAFFSNTSEAPELWCGHQWDELQEKGRHTGWGVVLRVLLSQALCAFLRGSHPLAWDSQASRAVFISVGISLLSAFFTCPLHEDTSQGLVLALCPLLVSFHPPAKPSLLPYLLLSPLLWIRTPHLLLTSPSSSPTSDSCLVRGRDSEPRILAPACLQHAL